MQLKVSNLATALEVSVPEGRFVYNTEAKNVTAFAAGSGITPIFSILKSALEAGSDTHFTLVYGNKSPEGTLYFTLS